MMVMTADTKSSDPQQDRDPDLLQGLANIDYERDNSDIDLPPQLVDIMQSIASTGKTDIEWEALKPLIVIALQKALKLLPDCNDDVNMYGSANSKTVLIDGATIDEFTKRIISAICHLNSAPWTIQRIFELLLHPKLYWSTKDKFIYAFSKVIFGIKSDETRFRFGSWTGNAEGELTFTRWPDTPVDEVALMDQRLRDVMDTNDVETVAPPNLIAPTSTMSVHQGERAVNGQSNGTFDNDKS